MKRLLSPLCAAAILSLCPFSISLSETPLTMTPPNPPNTGIMVVDG